jgi:hypothetical protein
MTNKDLLKQYVNSVIDIPTYQFDKLPNNLKESHRKMMINAIMNDPTNAVYYHGKLPWNLQMGLIEEDPKNIQYILDADYDVELRAVELDGFMIQYIHNPDKELQMAAVIDNPRAIGYIQNPDPEVVEYVGDDY